MRKINLVLVLVLVGVLLAPGVAVAKMADACCGVDVANLVVSDAPDPACEGDTVTISGTYDAFSDWGPWTELYDTGIEIRIYDSSMTMVDSYMATLGDDQSDPGDYPGTPWPFSYDWTAGMADTYTYNVIAWSQTGYGRMDVSIVGETITVEECIEIDIKPGSFPNSINLKGKGVIPVAILTNDYLDATTVDASSVTFGPAGATMVHEEAHLEDVDSDGDIDMVLHFDSQEVGLHSGMTKACLNFSDGVDTYTACDSVNIVPKNK